jgi:chitin deacetylase
MPVVVLKAKWRDIMVLERDKEDSMKKKLKAWRIILVVVCAAAALAFGVYEWMNARNFQIAGRIVSHADNGRKEVALTFDDGPSENTTDILDMLDELDVKCTFFLTGEAIENHMEETKAIVAAGHQVGNHSYSHSRMVFRSDRFITDELDETNDLIREAGYSGEIMFRPPFGKKLVLLPLALQKRGMTTVMWSLEPDSEAGIAGDAESIANAVAKDVKQGDIILLHIMYESGAAAREAVPLIVTQLREKGYSFVTVSELIE